MYYTEYVGKMIGKAFGGKVFYKEKNDSLVQGVIILDGMVKDYKSKIATVYKQCLALHKKYLSNKIKGEPEIEQVFEETAKIIGKNPLDTLTQNQDFDKRKSELAEYIDSNHYCQVFSLYSDKFRTTNGENYFLVLL